LGVAERVRFPGAAPQSELPAWYRAADALIISSRYESFGLVAVEALATGTPVVASAAGGLPSIVRDGVNGLLVPWRTPEAFAERLDLLLSDDTLRERLSAQARASVARLAWPHIGDAMRALFGELSAEAYEAVACCCF
ncbi:MAG TPA: glycosyltransferase, partial [Ktedonobacterales bacterium]